MKNLMFSLVVMLLIGSTAECATWEAMDSPTSETLRCVWGTAWDNVFAVGASGTILHYGVTGQWTLINSPTSHHLYGIWGSSADDIWAVGDNGTILRRQNGNEWQKQTGISSDIYLRDVWGAGPDDVYAVGEWQAGGGGILHWDGESWTDEHHGCISGPLGAAMHFNAVWGRGTNEVFVVGHSGYSSGIEGVCYKYDGSQWSWEWSGTGWPKTRLFYSIWGTADDLFIAAASFGGPADWFAQTVHYDGSEWRTEIFQESNALRDVWSSTSDDVYVVGYNGMILHGNSDFEWSVMDSGTTEMLTDVWGNGTGDVFVVGGNGTILRLPEPPCWQEQDKLLAWDGQDGDEFGISSWVSGEYAIVGAQHNDENGDWSGSAYIFKRDGSDWIDQAKLTASDGEAGDSFGHSVSISGDYAIGGTCYHDVNGLAEAGAAYIFKREGESWIEQAKLTASDAEAGARFGVCVSINGEYAIVGAYSDDVNGLENSGAAYIFKRDGDNWSDQCKLAPSHAEAQASFGRIVSIDGAYVIVSASGENAGGIVDSGAAYIFKRDGESWSEQARLTASDGGADDNFGVCGISGDYAIVGASQNDDNGSNSGSVYIFERPVGGWADMTETAKLTASDGAASDFFGHTVAISGNYCIVPAHYDDDNGGNSGSAYIFKRDGETWIEQDKLTPSDGTGSDWFGASVCISGNDVIVGAHGDDDKGSRSGSAYVFENVCNAEPVADAGEDQEVSTGPEGMAQVPLDGSGSSDADGDELTYTWYLDGEEIATGCNPIIELPCGTYIIELIVNDGIEDSEPDYVEITVADGTAPEIICPDDLVVECGQSTDPLDTGEATATDNCDDAPTIVYGGIISGTCPEIIERTWTATDESGNSSICVQVITVQDTTAPIITLNGPASMTLECGADVYTEYGATATDTCEGDVPVSLGGDIVDITTCGTYIVTYDATDSCGNSAIQIVRVVTVHDTTPPMIICPAEVELTYPADITPENTGSAIATDNCDDSPMIMHIDVNVPGCGKTELITRTWTATDDFGNSSLCEQIIAIINSEPLADANGPYIEPATSWDGAWVQLDGTGSSDPDGDDITYEWDLDRSLDSDEPPDGDPNNDVDATGAMPGADFPIGLTEISLVVIDECGARSEADITTVTVALIEVGVEIRSDDGTDTINLESSGVVRVTFLTDSDFDAKTVDPLTVTLRGMDFYSGLVKLRGKNEGVPMVVDQDFDGDGDVDRVVNLDTERLAEYEMDAYCEVGALTYDGLVVLGEDLAHLAPVSDGSE